MSRITTKLAAFAASALLIVASGCATTGGSAAEGSGPAGSKSSSKTDDQGDSTSSTAKIGDAYKFDDGLAIEIIRTKRTKASQSAAGADPGDPVAVLDLRVTNKTASNFDAALVDMKLSYGPDGDTAERVFDSTGDGLSGTIAKGKSKTGKYAFAVPTKHMGDVTVEVTPSFDHETALFEGKIAK